jgi:hypothetical protein
LLAYWDMRRKASPRIRKMTLLSSFNDFLCVAIRRHMLVL